MMERPTIRVGLFGFGRAGRAVAEELIKDGQVELTWVARRMDDPLSSATCAAEWLGLETTQGRFLSTAGMSAEALLQQHPVDMVVDFAGDAAVSYYGQAAARAGIGIISAVSHYDDAQIALLRSLGHLTRVLHAPNITFGINFLIVAAKALRHIAPQADIEVIEQHFRDKREVSGTAVRLADALELDSESQVNSIRVGGIIGKHEVIFGFPNQTIRLVHESISRNAFGQGALYALKQLGRRENGLYSMEDLVRQEFREMVLAD
jgi:4-hydroxy-tetrahydrodipicolinate reductase